MPLYLGIHKFPPEEAGSGDDQDWENYKKAASELGLKTHGVLVNPGKGVAYCQTEADSEEQVKEAHNKAQIPFEEIIEVQKFD